MLPTIYCQLIAKEPDIGGYTTYVFKNLESSCPFGHRYVMVTRLPNWNHKDLQIGDFGYVVINKVKAGVDTWYDGNNLIPYKYDHDQFMKLIPTGETRTELYTL